MMQIVPHRFNGAATGALRGLLAAFALAFFVVAFAANAMAADRRVALVIGNAQYKNASLALTNPKNDAEDVAAALRDLGFEVVYASDVTKQDFDMALARFARIATGADAALFYYAGHALQFQGRNYLMPVDAELEDDFSIRYQMESIDDVRDALERTVGVKILILDACRNNPVADRLQRKIYGQGRNVNLSRGLARIDRAQGLVVSYATAADQIAMDGRGRNSPYTTALLKRLREPGLEIEMMFRRIAADVNTQTDGKQRPETYVSLISEFYINQKDRMVWDGIKTADNADVVRDFIEAYPQSPYVAEAQGRLRALDQAVREKQAAAQKAQREAADARQLEEQRIRIAVLEREEKARADRDSAQKRADEERRTADAERLRKQDEERTRVAALERERTEQEALRQRQEAEQRAKADAAKTEAAKAEATKKLQDQQQERARLAALERERAEQEASQRQVAEQRAKADAARKRLEQEQERARIAALERDRNQQAAKSMPEPTKPLVAPVQPAAAPAQSQSEACKDEEQRLARLRAVPEAAEIVKFEREMTCARLRAQVARLRESVGVPESNKPSEPAAAQQPGHRSLDSAPDAAQASLESQTAMPAQATAATANHSCADEKQRLTELRTSRSANDIAQFIKDLRCESLRSQAMRLRESVGVK